MIDLHKSLHIDGRPGKTSSANAQAAWPGPGQQIFCLRERELDPAESLEPVERAPVARLSRVGRNLVVVLDRAQRKRCEFLTVEKPRRDGRGSYEQVFFRTESGIRAHRPPEPHYIQAGNSEHRQSSISFVNYRTSHPTILGTARRITGLTSSKLLETKSRVRRVSVASTACGFRASRSLRKNHLVRCRSAGLVKDDRHGLPVRGPVEEATPTRLCPDLPFQIAVLVADVHHG